MRKRIICLLLCVTMLIGLLPVGVLAVDGNSGSGSSYMKIFHLDCGRKYFSVSQIETVIDTLEANDYNYLELAVGNDGLRFLLEDMSVTVNGTAYTSDAVKAGIQAGNEAYYNDPNGNALTQTEMDTIISYARGKGISIIPLINSPGHMNAILSAAESLTGKSLSYNGSNTTINVTNTEAVAFTQTLLQKYIAY
ncbi:MAG: family 20 glycosylhydrolase, partial [Firmicutes bacterium]|nr:family 20 glycosylhydrolase [Bacillota bacterium]